MKEKMKEMMGSGMTNLFDGCNCNSFMEFCNTKTDEGEPTNEKEKEGKDKQ